MQLLYLALHSIGRIRPFFTSGGSGIFPACVYTCPCTVYRQGVYLHFSGVFVFPIYTRCLFSLCPPLINPSFSLLSPPLAHTPFYQEGNHLRFSPLPLYRPLYAPTRPLLYKEASLFIAAIHPPSALSQSLLRPFIPLAIPGRFLSSVLYILAF